MIVYCPRKRYIDTKKLTWNSSMMNSFGMVWETTHPNMRQTLEMGRTEEFNMLVSWFVNYLKFKENKLERWTWEDCSH